MYKNEIIINMFFHIIIMKLNDDLDREIFYTNKECEILHSYIKQMISNSYSVNVYAFNNIICNLI